MICGCLNSLVNTISHEEFNRIINSSAEMNNNKSWSSSKIGDLHLLFKIKELHIEHEYSKVCIWCVSSST